MNKLWVGSAFNLTKHRLGTGDIANHVEIEDVEYDAKEKTCIVTFGFIEGESGYEFEIDWDPEDGEYDEQTLLDEAISQLS